MAEQIDFDFGHFRKLDGSVTLIMDDLERPWQRDNGTCTNGVREKFCTSEPLPLNLKNPAQIDCADWWLVLSYKVSAQSDKYCKLCNRFENSKRRAPTAPLGENPTPSDCADWCLVSSCLNRIRTVGMAHSTYLGIIENSGSARLCGLMSSIIPPSFSSIGWIL